MEKSITAVILEDGSINVTYTNVTQIEYFGVLTVLLNSLKTGQTPGLKTIERQDDRGSSNITPKNR